MPTPLFNATTAKIFADLSVKARAENRKELDRLRRSAAALAEPDAAPADCLAAEIMKAMFAVLKGFEKRKPKEMAMCAQALRNLRESYHLVVCAPRPGQTRPWMRRPAPGSVSAGLALTIPEVIPPAGSSIEPPVERPPVPSDSETDVPPAEKDKGKL